MVKHLRKIIVFITILTVLSTLFYGINVSGASSNWSAVKGAPVLDDIEDGYSHFKVNAAASACSNESYNLEEKAVYIKNLELPQNTYWGVVAFSQSAKGHEYTSNPEAGLLALMIVGNKDFDDQLNLFFWNGSSQLEFGTISKSNSLSIRFVNTENGYALQVNEKYITHDYVKTFCNHNFQKTAMVNLYAYDYMGGDIKIVDHSWKAKSSVNTPYVYKVSEDEYNIVYNGEKGKFYSEEKIDFSTQKLIFDNVQFNNSTKLSIGLNLKNKAADKNDLTVDLTSKDEKIAISLGDSLTELGEIEKSSKYEISVSNNKGKYCLVVNGKVFDCGNTLSAFGASDKKAYVTVTIPKGFSASVKTVDLLWKQVGGSSDAVIKLNSDNRNHLELNAGQIVALNEKVDAFTTGIKLSNLDIPADKYLYICMNKNLENIAPDKASENGMTFAIKKTANGIAIYFINSNDNEVFVGEVAKSDTYDISINLYLKYRTLKVNGTHFRFNKLEGNEGKVVAQDVETFLGLNLKAFTYFAISANDNAKVDTSAYSFTKPVIPVGFSVNDGTIKNLEGDDNSGYTAKESKESYVVSNSVYLPTEKAIQARFKSVSGSVYFALSTTDITDTKFWVCENGATAKRFGFVITPDSDNTKAKIAYYGADGVNPTETEIDTIEFDWNAKNSFDVRKSTDGNWYLNINGEAVNKAVSTALNDFMDTNAKEDLFYIIGSKNGIDATAIKIISQPVTPVAEVEDGWTYYAGSKKPLEKDQDGKYFTPDLKSAVYIYRNGTEDISKTSVKLNINNIEPIRGTRYFYFAISRTDLSDTAVSPKGTVDKVNRVIFRMYADISSNKLNIKAYNDDANGGERDLATINFDFTQTHTFDIRLASDNNYYLCVDNKVVQSDGLFNLLQAFIDKYGTKALYYGIGAYGIMDASNIEIVEQAPGNVLISTETWHQVNSYGRGPFDGNDLDGYSFERDCTVFGYSDKFYDVTSTALKVKFTDIGGWACFSISKTDYLDLNWLPFGTGDEVNRVVILIVPFGDQAQIQYWCSDGVSSNPTVITTINNFDWFEKEHYFDIRQVEDDSNWYVAVDGRVLMNKSSQTLNQFMTANAGEKLRYGFGGMNCFGVEGLKVVDKPKAIEAEENTGGYDSDDFELTEDDFGFDLEFDNKDEESENDFELDLDTEEEYFEELFEEEEEEINPLDYLQKVKVKKRRLVSAAHGIIFTTFEKIAMVAGGVAVVAAAAVLVIFIIKKKKKAK